MLYYDLVVRGTVVSVRSDRVSSMDLWMLPPSCAEAMSKRLSGIRRVTLDIREILRGPDVGTSLQIVVPNFDQAYRTPYTPGDTLVVCLNYHERLNSYYVKSPYGKYVRRDGRWVCEETERGTRDFSDEDIRAKIESMEITNVAREAELIVTGNVTSVEKQEIEEPDGAATLVTLGMKISRVRKGEYSGDTISVVMITAGLHLPEWRKHVPSQYAIGQEWLACLRRGPRGWYPFAGTNGFFRVENGSLIYDERVPYWYTEKQVDAAIEREVEP